MDYELLLFALTVSHQPRDWEKISCANMMLDMKADEWIIKCIELPSNWFTLVLIGTRLSQCNRNIADRGAVTKEKLHEKTILRSFIEEKFKLLFMITPRRVWCGWNNTTQCAVTIIINCWQHSIRTRLWLTLPMLVATQTSREKAKINFNEFLFP